MLVAVMLLSLLMAVAIPEAFGERALLFAASYVALQVLATSFSPSSPRTRGTMARARRADPHLARRGGALWIAGAIADGRRAHCALAHGARGRLRSAVRRLLGPGVRRRSTDAWTSRRSHFAERFQLFIIIALGESIVVTGATPRSSTSTPAAHRVRASPSSAGRRSGGSTSTTSRHRSRGDYARRRTARLAATPTPTSTSRSSPASSSTAVGDEIVIAHPSEELPGAELAAVVAARCSTCSATPCSGCGWPER